MGRTDAGSTALDLDGEVDLWLELDRAPGRLGVRMTDFSTALQLDPREEHFRVPGPREGLSLFLRYLPAANTEFQPRRAVLYIHGATFPSALSIAHRFDGRSWRDVLNKAGFDVWGLDGAREILRRLRARDGEPPRNSHKRRPRTPQRKPESHAALARSAIRTSRRRTFTVSATPTAIRKWTGLLPRMRLFALRRMPLNKLRSLPGSF
jgi:hypothetical protein